MDFATISRLEENLNLDKKTLVILRWIAYFWSQYFSIDFVYFFLEVKFSVLLCHIVIAVGPILQTCMLQFGPKSNLLLKDLL